MDGLGLLPIYAVYRQYLHSMYAGAAQYELEHGEGYIAAHSHAESLGIVLLGLQGDF
jgi:hypothetical protein